MSRDNVKVQVDEGHVLVIKGAEEEGNKDEKEKNSVVWHVAERGKGEFSREIELPENVKLDQIKASVENGLLTILVPKDSTPKPNKLRNVHVTSRL